MVVGSYNEWHMMTLKVYKSGVCWLVLQVVRRQSSVTILTLHLCLQMSCNLGLIERAVAAAAAYQGRLESFANCSIAFPLVHHFSCRDGYFLGAAHICGSL